MRDIETPPDSDAEDEMNIQTVKKNAKRVTELLHQMMPNLDPSMVPTEMSPPLGMNRPDIMRAMLSNAAGRHGGPAAETPPSNRVAPKEGQSDAPPAVTEAQTLPKQAAEEQTLPQKEEAETQTLPKQQEEASTSS